MIRPRTLLLFAPLACGSTPNPPDTAQPHAQATPAAPVDATSVAARDCADEPGMLYIPGGETVYSEDRKTYQVGDLWLDRTEVTVAAFRTFVDAGFSPPWTPAGVKANSVCTWNLPDSDALPINCIDWYQAEAYCQWAGKRLPTAQEWGWAARGREAQRKYPWGDAPPSCEVAVVAMDDTDESRGCGLNRPWAVGTKPGDTTLDGLVDMFGNLGEFTSTGSSAKETSTRIGRGATWRMRGFASMAIDSHGGYLVREGWSEDMGVRCAKDPGPRPPCTRPPAKN